MLKIDEINSLDAVYEYADRIVGTLNRRFIPKFNKLKHLTDDEDIIEEVSEVYEEMLELVKEYYLLLAKRVYRRVATLLEEDIYDDIEALFILKILEDYDPVTKYVFTHEVDRKRARLIEALIASDDKPKEVENAKKLWARQIKQYADKVTDMAMDKVYIDNEIDEVIWETERDSRVCAICRDRQGKRYFRDEVPPKPHYGCRCFVRPIEAEDLVWNGYSR